VKQCVVVMQQLVFLFPKFGAKSLYIFTQHCKISQYFKEMAVWPARIEFFVRNHPEVKENDERALHLSRIFQFGQFGLFLWEDCCTASGS
jgi:hypothetical protein